MSLSLRFNQITPPSGILWGWLRRSQVRSCTLCGATVHVEKLITHTFYHARRGELDAIRQDPGQCENNGDRIVTIENGMAQVRPT